MGVKAAILQHMVGQVFVVIGYAGKLAVRQNSLKMAPTKAQTLWSIS
jgi:hypothetical protein